MTPAGYEKMRDSFIRKGLTKKAAQRKAAKIWNSRRKKGQKPVTGGKH